MTGAQVMYAAKPGYLSDIMDAGKWWKIRGGCEHSYVKFLKERAKV